MNTEESASLVSRYMTAHLNGDYETVSELLSDELSHNFSRSGITVDMATKQDAVRMAKSAGPVDIKFHDMIASGDKVVVRYSYTISSDAVAGAIPGTTAEVTGIAIVRVENGKIREIWQEQDVLAMLLAFGMRLLPAKNQSWDRRS